MKTTIKTFVIISMMLFTTMAHAQVKVEIDVKSAAQVTYNTGVAALHENAIKDTVKLSRKRNDSIAAMATTITALKTVYHNARRNVTGFKRESAIYKQIYAKATAIIPKVTTATTQVLKNPLSAGQTIDNIMNQPHDGLLSLSIFLCLIFGSSGIVAIFNGFRNVYANIVIEKGLTLRGWLVQRTFAVLMLIIIGALIVVSVVLIALGGTALKYLVTHEIIEGGSFTFFLFSVLRWVISIFALCFGIALLYYFGNVTFNEHYRVERKKKGPNGEVLYRNFVIFSPGTLLATSLFILGTVGFNTYISNFSRYNVLYGSIGTLIILMLWIWLVAILILAGNDLNSGIRRNADKLSAGEDNIRRREVVIEDLKRHIRAYQKSNEVLMEKISGAKKTIDEQQVLIQNLEGQVKNNELIIRAYTRFVEYERKKAAAPYEIQDPTLLQTEENKA